MPSAAMLDGGEVARPGVAFASDPAVSGVFVDKGKLDTVEGPVLGVVGIAIVSVVDVVAAVVVGVTVAGAGDCACADLFRRRAASHSGCNFIPP